MSDKFNARKGLEIGRGLAEDATIEVKNSSGNFPYVKYSETEKIWKFSNDGTTENEFGLIPTHEFDTENQLVRFMTPAGWGGWLDFVGSKPTHKWEGNVLSFELPNGTWGKGINLMPQHTWDDTKLSFENPDGTFGEETQLMPSHEWNLSPTTKKIKFQNPEGGYGDEIDLSSYNYFFTEDKIGEVKEWIWTNCPENFLKLDGSTLQKIDNEGFFEFLIAEGEVLDTDTEYTLPTQANKIIRVKTSLNAIYKIVDSVPVGVVNALATETIPEGWLECNGAELSREIFSELFEKIGTTFGKGNNSTTFNLPDLRGKFIRGWDNNRGVDPNRVFGSSQEDELKEHIHKFRFKISDRASDWKMPMRASTTSLQDSYYWDTEKTGGVETRPKNIALKYIIKYKIGDGRLS